MEISAFILGIVFSVIVLPITFLLLVSIRRSALDGKKLNELSNKYIFITGCDRGFGFELAKRLDYVGCHVIAACLTKKGLENVRDVTSSRAHTILLDVSDSDAVFKAAERVRDILPSPDALWGIVNNAGIMVYAGPMEFDTLENMRHILDVNLWGTVAVTKAFIPYLKKSKGRIVNVSSMLSRIGLPTQAAYCISKSGVSLFSDTIRQELFRFHVSVHVIEPGAFQTDLLDISYAENTLKKFWDQAPDELKEQYGEVWFSKAKNSLKQCFRIASPKRHKVVDCMEHALLSLNPKLRYFPGYDSGFGMWWWSFLPGEITDLPLKLLSRQTPLGVSNAS